MAKGRNHKMTFYQLYTRLNEKYPIELRCDWDNDGLMCSFDLNRQVKNILVALDVTMDTVDYAIENGYDTIISHHPLVFRSQKGLTSSNYTQKKLIRLIKNNINVLSFHTRLDAVDGGVNDTLCKLIGLKNVSKDELDPIGRIGELDNTLELSTFAENIKKILNSSVVLYAGDKIVKRVYVVGGDGKDLIENAITCGADTLLTGRASYNTMIDAKDMGINIIEAGHFFTENPVCNEIKKHLLEISSDFNASIYNSNNISVK